MKTFYILLTAVLFAGINFTTIAAAADVNGLWTKTTSPDPYNITIFYNEKSDLRAMGYSEIEGEKIVWYAEGEIEGKRLQCFYHYSQDALPPGWESEGIMKLRISDDGNVISGTATSKSGNWTGEIEFKRIQLTSPSTKIDELGPARRKTLKFAAAEGLPGRSPHSQTDENEKSNPASRQTKFD